MANFFQRSPSAISNPLEKLKSNSKSMDTSFPVEDATTYLSHYINFHIFKTKRITKRDKDTKHKMSTITLPMPMELTVGYNASYSSEDLGGLAALGLDAAGGVKTLIESISKDYKKEGENSEKGTLQNILSTIGTTLGQVNASKVAGNAAGAAANQLVGLGGSIAQAATQQFFGVARNPHKAVLFQGTDFRSHSFNYRLSPVSYEDTLALHKIIKLFKYHMAPSYAGNGNLGNHFFSLPEYFTLEFAHPTYLFETVPCVLTKFNVNYHPQNYPAYVRSNEKDPAPMEVVISLDFQEVEIITKEVIGNPYTEDEIKSQNSRELNRVAR